MDTDSQQGKAWVEDGIIFIKYVHVVDLDLVTRMQDQALEAVLKAQVTRAPLIIDLHGEAQGKPKLGLQEIGKVVNHELSKYMTGIWIVGKKDEMLDPLTKVFNKFFLGGRMHWVDTIEQAREAAKQYISNNSSILENDN